MSSRKRYYFGRSYGRISLYDRITKLRIGFIHIWSSGEYSPEGSNKTFYDFDAALKNLLEIHNIDPDQVEPYSLTLEYRDQQGAWFRFWHWLMPKYFPKLPE